jgi:hypothetical protein
MKASSSPIVARETPYDAVPLGVVPTVGDRARWAGNPGSLLGTDPDVHAPTPMFTHRPRRGSHNRHGAVASCSRSARTVGRGRQRVEGVDVVNTVVNDTRCRSGGPHPTPRAPGRHDPATASDGDDLVRPGDEHVNGTESLCVGESQ